MVVTAAGEVPDSEILSRHPSRALDVDQTKPSTDIVIPAKAGIQSLYKKPIHP
jgi:hypothetical protein